MCGDNGRPDGHDQECTPGNPLDVTAETENETRDKIYDASGNRVVQVLQVDEDRGLLTKVLTDNGDILKVSGAHYCNVETVSGGKLVAGDFIVGKLTDVLGSVPALVN